MEIMSLFLNVVMIWLLAKLTTEVKLAKCKLNRFEMLRKCLYKTQRQEKDTNAKPIELVNFERN